MDMGMDIKVDMEVVDMGGWWWTWGDGGGYGGG